MPEKDPFAFQAARASWFAPLIAIGLGALGNGVMANNPTLEEGAPPRSKSGDCCDRDCNRCDRARLRHRGPFWN